MIRHVGVIGLGIIGRPIAERILAAGYPLSVYDVRPEPVADLARVGARACVSAAEVAHSSELVISLVLDRAQTEQVVLGPHGILDVLRPGSLLAIGSTLGPNVVRRPADAVHSSRSS